MTFPFKQPGKYPGRRRGKLMSPRSRTGVPNAELWFGMWVGTLPKPPDLGG